ncbi:MAG TPA: alpha/beta hydrolase [Bacteroidetes bacterium]|nr:alpha/beta hydrolase [Bacteroidota bacterium]
MLKTTFQHSTIAAYQSGGKQGIPVVLLHGFCEDSRMWDEWLPLLPPRLPCLRIDLPGFGRSELPGPVTIESMADAVAAVLKNQNIDRCLLLGHSMGGYVACAFAEKYPAQLAGLCMFHSHPFADSEEKKAARTKAIEFIRKNGHVLFVRQMIPGLFAYDYSKGYPSEVNRLIFYATQYDPEAIIAALAAMRQRPDRSHVLKNIQCPVLFFIGKQDPAIPLSLSLAQTHLPAVADIQIYDDTGHMGMFKSPRRTAKAFRNFIKFLSDNTNNV